MGGWYDLSREPGNYVRYPGHSIAARHGGSLIEDLRQGLSFPADPHAPEPDALAPSWRATLRTSEASFSLRWTRAVLK